eukprot:jgi/Mesvir1/11809/Mv00166-RA.1
MLLPHSSRQGTRLLRGIWQLGVTQGYATATAASAAVEAAAPSAVVTTTSQGAGRAPGRTNPFVGHMFGGKLRDVMERVGEHPASIWMRRTGISAHRALIKPHIQTMQAGVFLTAGVCVPQAAVQKNLFYPHGILAAVPAALVIRSGDALEALRDMQPLYASLPPGILELASGTPSAPPGTAAVFQGVLPLALFLLHSRVDTRSHFWHYARHIPQEPLPCGLTLSDADISARMGSAHPELPSALAGAAALRRMVSAFTTQLHAGLAAQKKSDDGELISKTRAWTEKDLTWAFSVAINRSLALPTFDGVIKSPPANPKALARKQKKEAKAEPSPFRLRSKGPVLVPFFDFCRRVGWGANARLAALTRPSQELAVSGTVPSELRDQVHYYLHMVRDGKIGDEVTVDYEEGTRRCDTNMMLAHGVCLRPAAGAGEKVVSNAVNGASLGR